MKYLTTKLLTSAKTAPHGPGVWRRHVAKGSSTPVLDEFVCLHKYAMFRPSLEIPHSLDRTIVLACGDEKYFRTDLESCHNTSTQLLTDIAKLIE